MKRYLFLLCALLLLAGCTNNVFPPRATEGVPPPEEATSPPTAGPDGQRKTPEPTAEPEMSPTPAPPSITVEDQQVGDNNSVTVAEVVSPQAGWIVIHADEDGAPGPVIGHEGVEPGKNANVMVEIDVTALTGTLYAMLHADEGQTGVFEFPDGDPPAHGANGDTVFQPFAVTQD